MIHPKLHQMDQDKVAKLYGELRRESLVRERGKKKTKIRFSIFTEKFDILETFLLTLILVCPFV